MQLGPVTRQSVSDQVYARLRGQILTGELAAGQALPAERYLAESFEVNRHAVREALKRLQQAGLVRIAQGGATRVSDYRTTGGLDLLPQLVGDGSDVDAGVLRAGLEMRRCIGAEVAASAAQRAGTPQRRAIVQAGRAMADPADAADRHARHRALWALLVDAADNIAYRLAFNSLVDIIDRSRARDGTVFSAEVADSAGHLALAESVAGGHHEAAARLARRLLSSPLDHLAEQQAEAAGAQA